MEILYPSFAMFALTAFVVARLAILRVSAIKNREIDYRFYVSYRDYEEPERLRIASRHVVNHFEMPMLFYVVVILVFVTGQTTPLLVALAWLYVAARGVHSYIHLTSNKVVWRFRVFGLSGLILAALWIALAVGLLSA